MDELDGTVGLTDDIDTGEPDPQDDPTLDEGGGDAGEGEPKKATTWPKSASRRVSELSARSRKKDEQIDQLISQGVKKDEQISELIKKFGDAAPGQTGVNEDDVREEAILGILTDEEQPATVRARAQKDLLSMTRRRTRDETVKAVRGIFSEMTQEGTKQSKAMSAAAESYPELDNPSSLLARAVKRRIKEVPELGANSETIKATAAQITATLALNAGPGSTGAARPGGVSPTGQALGGTKRAVSPSKEAGLVKKLVQLNKAATDVDYNEEATVRLSSFLDDLSDTHGPDFRNKLMRDAGIGTHNV